MDAMSILLKKMAKSKNKNEQAFVSSLKKNANMLSKLINDLNIKIPKEQKNESVNWYLYTISTSKRNKILSKLRSKGIEASSYYSHPVHRTPYYKNKIKLPITDWAAAHVLSLPIHPKVSSKNIEFIAKSLREILNE